MTVAGRAPASTEVGLGTPPGALGDPLIGHLVDSKYRICGVLGAGGMSIVYHGEHVAIGRRVAIKVLHRHCATHPALVERFEREARTAARIAHPNIVDILDFGRLANGLPYIVMELLEGQGLFERLSASGAMPVARAIEIVLEVLSTLDAAHRVGVFHRDVKPENVFLAKAADGAEIVKVMDFGVAKVLDLGPGGPRLTGEGLAVGTPAYMPPEQAMGRDDIDGRSDLYSTGVLLYELLSHRLPHEGSLEVTIAKLLTEEPTPLRDLAPWVPASLAAVVHKAIAYDRAARYQTAGELMEALRVFTALPTIEVGTLPRFRAASASTASATAQVAVGNETPTPLRPKVPRVRLATAALVALLAVGLLGSVLPGTPGDPASVRPEATRRVTIAPRPGAVTLPPTSVPVTITANVAGARVLLDGRPLGTTPLETTVPASPAAQLLVIEADRFVPATYWVRTGSPVRVTVALARVAEASQQGAADRAPRARRATRPRLPFYRVY